MNYPKFLQSSVDPTQLSMMVRGFLMALVPILMVVTGMSENEFTPIFDAAQLTVFYLTSAVAALWVVWGGIRKIAVALGWMK